MKQTKQKVIDAAISLFNTKGYDGTSVRDIAKRADVNVANISCYFAGKQGLLEQLITDFLEGYIHVIETSFEQREYLSAKDVMVQMVRGILRYQFENRELTRFFYRELSLDTTLIREVLHSFPSDTFVVEMYTKEIEQWMEQTLCITNMHYEWPRAVHM